MHTLISVPPLRKARVSVVVCPHDYRDVSVVGSLNAARSGMFRAQVGCVCFHLLGRPVGDLPALQHRPPVSFHVVKQRDHDAGAHQQLGGGGKGAERLIPRLKPRLHPV